MIKGVIFDLDGLVVKTEELHCRTWVDTLAARDITLAPAEFYDIWTRQGGGIQIFLKQRGIELDVADARKEKRQRYHDALRQELQLYEHARPAITRLGQQYPLALVTGSYGPDCHLIVDLAQIREYFNPIVSRSDVTYSKPHPEGLWKASEAMGIPAAECVVLEDAEKGIVAAYRAGMKSIAVPNQYTADHDFSKADRVVEDLGEVTIELIESMGS